MRVEYKVFRSSFGTWDDLFSQAAAFATELGLTRVINISHSVQATDGTVTVWYWSDDGSADEPSTE